MGWRSIKIKDEQKQQLDKKKQELRKRKGVDPSYSDIIEDMIEGDQDKEKRKRKKKEGDDLMNLF